jgi:hypothetical protein
MNVQLLQCGRTGQSGEHALPKGPEVSYGIPFRWSAARLLAGDVKSLLCGTHHNNTPECKSLMDESAWGLESFIKHFTTDASALFSVHNASGTNIPSLDDAVQSGDDVEDADLWDGPNASWIGCSQQPGPYCIPLLVYL